MTYTLTAERRTGGHVQAREFDDLTAATREFDYWCSPAFARVDLRETGSDAPLKTWTRKSRTLPLYTVPAAAVDGEWLDEPDHIGEVDEDEWNARKDTDDVHHDCYEEDGETRAIEVHWVDADEDPHP